MPISLADFFCSEIYDHEIIPKAQVQIESQNQIQNIHDEIEKMQNYLKEISKPKKGYKNILDFFYEDSLGNLTFTAQEITFMRNSLPFQFHSFDKIRIDGMVLYHNQEAQNNQSPMVIFCNPNAGYYETLGFESPWIDFYHDLGINVCIWNYRGFGRSQGTPTPQNLQKDGLYLYDYLQSNFKVTKFGVHGHSMGGMVACHVGNHRECAIVIADRTFESLHKVGVALQDKLFRFGPRIDFLLKILPHWNVSVTKDYLNVKNFKVIAQDPQDNVIPYQSSLKSSVIDYFLNLYDIQLDSIDRIFYMLQNFRNNQVLIDKQFFKVMLVNCQQNSLPLQAFVCNNEIFCQSIQEIQRQNENQIKSKIIFVLTYIQIDGVSIMDAFEETSNQNEIFSVQYLTQNTLKDLKIKLMIKDQLNYQESKQEDVTIINLA